MAIGGSRNIRQSFNTLKQKQDIRVHNLRPFIYYKYTDSSRNMLAIENNEPALDSLKTENIR